MTYPPPTSSMALVETEEALAKAVQEQEQTSKDGRLLTEVVDKARIATIVSRWTGVPVSKLSEGGRTSSSASRSD